MKLLVSWLQELCPVDRSAEELADLLSARGAGVESISRPWAGLEGVIVARVIEVTDHPDSDTLCLARVDTGAGEARVVVGVRNMQAGDVVPYAPPGASVPGLPEPLGVRTIRGERSDGMLCSPRELAVSNEHSGILVLPPDSPVGADVRTQFGLDDTVLEVEVTPNRPDFLSVIGLAREVAAATGTPLTVTEPGVEEGEERAEDAASVRIDDLDRCPRYLAQVIRGVTLGPSPLQVQARLTATGMRPLSNVVDATNYVMLERGQPLHPFDLDRLSGHAIIVRRAHAGEALVTLDDVERTLTAEDLVIADAEKGVAIAGVMGSADAEVSSSTNDVLLESATFERTGVLRTARRLGLSTEASIRFERGVDPEAVPAAAALAAALIAEWSGGTVLAGAVSEGDAPPRRHVTVRPDRATHVLGYPVTGDDVVEVFGRLGMETTPGPDAIDVEIPGYRVDLEAEVDLVEEIARVQGYDRVGSELPGIRHPGGVPATYLTRRSVRNAMVRAGLRETWSFSFSSKEDVDRFGEDPGVPVANPLAADDAYLRTSLIPGLIRAVRTNLFRQVDGVALFEVGHVFRTGDPVDEREHAAFVMTGSVAGFPGEDRDFDLYDGKGAVESLLEGLGVPDWTVGEPAGGPFHPGRSATIEAVGTSVGRVGELHPRLARELDLPERVVVGEIDVTALADKATPSLEVRPVPRFPAARRDLAWVVDGSIPARRVQDVIEEAGAELLESCRLFDLFAGAPIPGGKKSLAFAVTFRAGDRTLTDEEVDAAVAAIDQQVAAEVGGELRAG